MQAHIPRKRLRSLGKEQGKSAAKRRTRRTAVPAARSALMRSIIPSAFALNL